MDAIGKNRDGSHGAAANVEISAIVKKTKWGKPD